MRNMIVALALGAFAMGALVQPAAAAKSKMGCEIGKEVWNATAGKCVAGKSKYARMAASKSAKKAAKKAAPAAKGAPAAKTK